jgi:hypothetical protein
MGTPWTAVTTCNGAGKWVKFNIVPGPLLDGTSDQPHYIFRLCKSLFSSATLPPCSFRVYTTRMQLLPATDNYLATTGTVTITSIDETNKKISGTFEFTGKKNLTESVSITNGTFSNLGYQEK